MEPVELSLPQDFDLKERVRAAVDIVDVIGATLSLIPRGRNFVALCPWHNDRRPSLTVNPERQTWKCWPCNIGGDVFSFVKQRDGVEFPDAVRILAEHAGIPIGDRGRGRRSQPGSPNDKATLRAALQLIADAYFELLEHDDSADAQLARQYLADRGFSDESRRLFRIGFAPDAWDFAVNLLQRNRFSGEVAQAAGIAAARRSGDGFVDMFRGRLMFPIHDLQGRPIALGGRVIPQIAQRHGDRAGGKYINSRETLLFRKSNQLYGLDKARDAIRRDGQVLVMEGYTDVVAARQAGVEPVVAVLGTALGERHVKILTRFAQRVVLVLDGDAAGQRRADEVLELFVAADVDLRVLTLPEQSDPADFLAAHGTTAFRQLVDQAPDAFDHKLARLTEGIDLNRDTHAVTTALGAMLETIAAAPDELKSDRMLARLAQHFDIRQERLQQRLQYLRGQRSRRSAQRPAVPQAAAPPRRQTVDPNLLLAESGDSDEGAFGSPAVELPTGGAPELPAPISGIDRELFEMLIEKPDLVPAAVESIDPAWLHGTLARMLLSAYQDLELDGRNLDVETVLLVIENDQLKNEVVTLIERLPVRTAELSDSSDQRFAGIMARYRHRALDLECDREIDLLESATMDEEAELARLEAVFGRLRDHHGINSSG